MAFDCEHLFELPPGFASNAVRASSSCLTVPVLHAQDVETPEDAGPDDLIPKTQVRVTVAFNEAPHAAAEFEGSLACPSGRLCMGDAETKRVVAVPLRTLRVQVSRRPIEFADEMTLFLTSVDLG